MVSTFLLLFIIPFFVAPFGQTDFETPKVLAGEAIILLTFFYALFRNTLPPFKITRIFIPLGIIIFLTIINLFFFKTDTSFFGNQTRLQGIFLLWSLMIFSFLAAKYSLEKISWKIFVGLLFFETLLMFYFPVTADNRYVGSIGEPNALGAYIIFLWPFIFFNIKKFGKVEMISVSITASIVASLLILTHSRSATIGCILELLFIALTSIHISIKKALCICLVLYMLSYSLPFFSQTKFENRVEIWRTAVFSGWEKPFLGNGFGNTEYALAASAKQLRLPIQFSYVDSTHNIFLDWWVQGGIAGLGSFLTLCFFAVSTFVKKHMEKELVLFIGLMTALSFNPPSVVGLIGLWWLLGRGIFSSQNDS